MNNKTFLNPLDIPRLKDSKTSLDNDKKVLKKISRFGYSYTDDGELHKLLEEGKISKGQLFSSLEKFFLSKVIRHISNPAFTGLKAMDNTFLKYGVEKNLFPGPILNSLKDEKSELFFTDESPCDIVEVEKFIFEAVDRIIDTTKTCK